MELRLNALILASQGLTQEKQVMLTESPSLTTEMGFGEER